MYKPQKKLQLLIASILMAATALYAQEQNTNTNNFFEEIQRFYQETGGECDTCTEGGAFHTYQKRVWFWGSRLHPAAGWDKVLAGANSTYNYWKKNKSTTSTKSNGDWNATGPFNTPQGSTVGHGNGVGRVENYTIDPNNANVHYAATVFGGLFKSTNAGSSWSSITHNMPFYSISCVEVAPSNSQTLFIGTGNYHSRIGSKVDWFGAIESLQHGIYMSNDGGNTWIDANNGYMTTPVEFGFVADIAIDEIHTNQVYIATSKGLYYTDGAPNNIIWTKIADGVFRDLVFRNGSTELVASSTSDIVHVIKLPNFPPTVNTILGASRGFELNNVTNNSDYIYSIDIAGSPADGYNSLYASILSGNSETPSWNTTRKQWIAKYNFSTNNWQYYYDATSEIKRESDIGAILDNTNDIAVSPNNADEVYIGGAEFYRTRDASNVSNWGLGYAYWNSPPHPDVRKLYFADNGDLYILTDGGVARTNQPYTAYATSDYEYLNNGLNIGLISYLDRASLFPNYTTLGQFDMGTFVGTKNGTTIDWKHMSDFRGDGGSQAIVVDDDTKTFSSNQSSTIIHNKGIGKKGVSSPSSPYAVDKKFLFPIETDPNNPSKFYSAWRELFEGTVNGNTITWNNTPLSKISDDKSFDRIRVHNFEIAPTNSNVIYLSTLQIKDGTSYHKLYKTETHGIGALCQSDCWEDITPKFAPGNDVLPDIKSITINPNNTSQIWIALPGYFEGHKVYHYDGESWSNVSDGLPNVPTNKIVIDKCGFEGQTLYLGTDYGVFYKTKSMNSWELFGNNLPNVIVTDLKIIESESKIIAGTYGRGLWEAELERNTNGADLSMLDRKNDSGEDEGYPWTWDFDDSPDIWVRNNNDGLVVQEHEANLEYNASNPFNLYVRVTNRGCEPTSGDAKISLYWSKAATSFQWPEGWNGSSTDGDKIGEQFLGVMQPGEVVIKHFTWNPPLQVGENWENCLLGRIEDSQEDPITVYPEHLEHDIYRNNNVSLRNLKIHNEIPGIITDGLTTDIKDLGGGKLPLPPSVINDNLFTSKFIYIGNSSSKAANFDFVLRSPSQFESLNFSNFPGMEIEFTREGWKLMKDIVRASNNILEVAPRTIKALTQNVEIKDVYFPANTRVPVKIRFTNFLTDPILGVLERKDEYMYHISQKYSENDPVMGDAWTGNYHFKVKTTKVEDVIAPQLTEKPGIEYVSGNYGLSIAISEQIITSLTPNPASNEVTIEFKSLEAKKVEFLITEAGAINNTTKYILDEIETNKISIDVSSHKSGSYFVSLICDGKIVDSKILLIQ